MTRRFWRLILFVAIFLLTYAAAAPQKSLDRRVFEERYRHATGEMVRSNPEVAKKLREAFNLPGNVSEKTGAERLGAVLRQQLKDQKLTVRVDKKDPKEIFKLERRSKRTESKGEVNKINSLLGRKVLSMMRQEKVLEEMGGKEVTLLDGLRRDNQAESDLEAYLKKVGVIDYAEVANSFDWNIQARAFPLPEEVTLLRIFGGKSKPIGRYLFCCLEAPENAPESIQRLRGPYSQWTDARGLALPPGNLLKDLAVVTLPAGTEVITGTVANNFEVAAGKYKLGGNTQVFVPAVKNSHFDHYRRAGKGSQPLDILVRFDGGRVLRFRPSSSLDGTVRDR